MDSDGRCLCDGCSVEMFENMATCFVFLGYKMIFRFKLYSNPVCVYLFEI